MRIEALETPAVLIDLDQVEANIAAMQTLANRHGLRLRPHAKTSKAPAIVRMQLQAGACGICCAKLSEAEVMIASGVADVLLTSPVVSPGKQARVAALQNQARLSVAVDHAETARGLAAAARGAGVEIGVHVELDVGQGRTGIGDPVALAELAAQVRELPGLRLDGIQAYNGSIQFLPDHNDRQQAASTVAARIHAARQAFASRGIAVASVSGGGTGSAGFDVMAGAIDELQCGSYVYMDGQYQSLAWPDSAPRFGLALTVLATVISVPTPTRAVVDTGWKSLSMDAGLPTPINLPGARFRFGGDEHGIIEVDHPQQRPALGQQVRFRPSHVDTTINLHDRAWSLRGEVVHGSIEVAARGCVS